MRSDPLSSVPPQESKPFVKLVPMWIVILISGIMGLLLGGYIAWLEWHHHRPVDWGGAIFNGLFLFAINVGLQLWVGWSVRKRRP